MFSNDLFLCNFPPSNNTFEVMNHFYIHDIYIRFVYRIEDEPPLWPSHIPTETNGRIPLSGINETASGHTRTERECTLSLSRSVSLSCPERKSKSVHLLKELIKKRKKDDLIVSTSRPLARASLCNVCLFCLILSLHSPALLLKGPAVESSCSSYLLM